VSGPLLPVVEGRCIYGGGVTAGGRSAGGGVAGGAAGEGVAGERVTGGGATVGGGIAGGATAHAMTVLSIPRPKHIIRRRETIGRTPFRVRYPVIHVIAATPVMSKTCAMIPGSPYAYGYPVRILSASQCSRTPSLFFLQESKTPFVPVKFIYIFSDTQSIYNRVVVDNAFFERGICGRTLVLYPS
jgi:hypothetical protein